MASQGYYDRVQDFATKLRQRKICTSLDAAKGTAELLRQLVTSSKLSDPQSLLEEVKNVGNKLQAALPTGARGGACTRHTDRLARYPVREKNAFVLTLCIHAELVIGNIARRVLHIIREELEEDQEGHDDDIPTTHSDADLMPTPGGLSKAFR